MRAKYIVLIVLIIVFIILVIIDGYRKIKQKNIESKKTQPQNNAKNKGASE